MVDITTTYGLLTVKPNAAGMAAARAVRRVMYFIVEGVREDSLAFERLR